MIQSLKNRLLINYLHLNEGRTKLFLELTGVELAIDKIKFAGPITLDAELFKSGDTIVLSGKVNFRTELSCVSCLNEHQKEFNEKIYQEYLRSVKPISVPSAHLDEIDFVREYYSTDFVDLTPLVRDTILLAVPIAPWCREDCPGVSA